MNEVKPTVSIQPAKSTDRISESEIKKTEETRSQYTVTKGEGQTAGMGEVLTPDWLAKVSLKQYESLKEDLSRVETQFRTLADKKDLETRKEVGLVRAADQLLKRLEKEPKGSTKGKELSLALKNFETHRLELEEKLSSEKPKALEEGSWGEVARSKLSRLLGTEISKATTPEKVRALFESKFQSHLEKVRGALKKIQSEKGSAEKLASLKKDEAALLQTEKKILEQQQALSFWVKKLEEEEVVQDLQPELVEGEERETPLSSQSHSVSTQAASSSRRGQVGISSAGHSESDYEGGLSEYIEVQNSAQTLSDPTAADSIDLTGTNYAVMQQHGDAQQNLQKLKQVTDRLLKKLASGDLRVLELCFIAVTQEASLKTASVTVKFFKSFEQMDKSYDEMVKKMADLSSQDPSYSSKVSLMNMEGNKLAMDKNMALNFVRTSIASMEELQNITKGVLDVRLGQLRYLSRISAG